jgi:predicted unusual protein kinase regulating ubiquinone biosynthesis (AarF/ABC1/UbiB family)
MADDKSLHRLNTGAFSRRFQLSKAGLRYGSRALRHSLMDRFSDDEEASATRRRENIEYFVAELGQLKGSVVKIGQIMATYGDYLLPPEVVEALHSLEDDTPPMSWQAIQKVLAKELGEERLADLEIEEQALAAASLGQVHKATLRSTGEKLCIKVQYPGVENTIDADFNAVLRLLKISRLLQSTRSAEEWFSDIRTLLYKEVDYDQERRDMDFVRESLVDDSRFVVPMSFPEYSTRRVLTMSYESGHAVGSADVAALSQPRKNRLGKAILDEFLTELFSWRRMQTDPNFGNFRVRIDQDGEIDQLILLDFGAMRLLPEEFAAEFCDMMLAAYHCDREMFLERSISLGFMKEHFPDKVLQNFVDIGMDIGEPLRKPDDRVPSQAVNELGEYDWRGSKLPKRIAKRALEASMSKYFALPPKEFLYVMRKLMGVYALISQLDAQFNGDESMAPFL